MYFNKFTIGLHFFFSYNLYACKIFKNKKTISYFINQIFKFQDFVVYNFA